MEQAAWAFASGVSGMCAPHGDDDGGGDAPQEETYQEETDEMRHL